MEKAIEIPHKHLYDYVVPDSEVEARFAEGLEGSADVVVYVKLPRGFKIPTLVGDYNPDWAIACQDGVVRHVYFVAETKGTLSSMELRPLEKAKTDCACKFFPEISVGEVSYEVVDSYQRLMDIVKKVECQEKGRNR